MINENLRYLLKKNGLKTDQAEKILYGLDINGVDGDDIKKAIVGGDPQNIDESTEPPKQSTISKILNVIKSKSKEEILAGQIVQSLKYALEIVTKTSSADKTNKLDHAKQVTKDIEKIKKFEVPKQIDMNYGGGFIVFDSNFNIKDMIYTCYKDNNPKFASIDIKPTMPNNAINTLLQGNMQTYSSKKIVEKMNKIIKPFVLPQMNWTNKALKHSKKKYH